MIGIPATSGVRMAHAPVVREPRFGIAGNDNQAVQRVNDFYEPKPNRLITFQAKQLFHAVAKALGAKVMVPAADRKLLKALEKETESGKSAVIFAFNHSSDLDIFILMETLRQSGIQMTAMGAHEIFEPQLLGKQRPVIGKLLQRMGLFSVDRENQDKAATLDAARDILRDGKHLFVIAPEGRVLFTNRQVGPLRYGAARLAMDVAQGGKPVKIVPVSFYIQHRRDITPTLTEIAGELESALEKRLQVTLPKSADLTARTQNLFGAMVSQREQQYQALYGISPLADPFANPYRKLDYLREQVLTHLEQQYHQSAVHTGLHEIRTRKLGGVLRQQAAGLSRERETLEAQRPNTKSQARIAALKAQEEAIQRDGVTLHDMISLTRYPDGYLPAKADQERLTELLMKLHDDILDEPMKDELPFRLNLIRKAGANVHVRVGQPLEVGASRGLSTDKTAVATLTDELSMAIQNGLDRTAQELSR